MILEGELVMSLESWKLAGEENRKQNEFVKAHIQENFGDTPTPVLATSEALNAYHKSLGFVFKADEETFILPE